MQVLVTYATRYGATTGIAERIGERLRAAGLAVEVRTVDADVDVAAYDAVVVGSAIYVGNWLPDATTFVREHADVLAARPTWLFSSGPLSSEPTDPRGRDLRTVAAPSEYDEFRATVEPRDAVVFYGALVPSQLSFKDRSIRRLPVGRELLPEGDYRDWESIDAWAGAIARDLGAVTPDDILTGDNDLTDTTADVR